MIQKRKQIQNLLQQKQLKYDYDNLLLNTRIEVQEQAFETVSREIHDNIGQVLSLGCVQLASLKYTIGNTEMAEKLNDTLQLFKKSVKDLRLLSHSLNTGLVGHKALEQSVRSEFDRIETFSNISCTMEVMDDEEALTSDQRLVVFRIIQEALQNILKHAEATAISVRLDQNNTNFTACVKDNGKGFLRLENQAPESLGLVSMQQRASLLKARLTINSLPGQGTEVTLDIPLHN